VAIVLKSGSFNLLEISRNVYPYDTSHMTYALTILQQILVRWIYYKFDVYGTVNRSAIAVAGNQKLT
jgi:hypothetical protein